MPVTPVKIMSDATTSELGRCVAQVAVQGYEKYPVIVPYWAELKNDPTTGTPKGYGPTLAAKWLVKEAALIAPTLVAEGLKKRQDALAVEADAAKKTTLQAEISELTALKGIVTIDAVPRIDAFYTDLKALVGATDPRWANVYQKEWDAAKAQFAAPALPATI